MKKTDVLVNSLVYAAYMLVSCIIVMIAETLITRIIGSFFNLSPFALCVIRAVIYTPAVTALLGVLAYREGYRAAYFSAAGTAISGAIAAIMHLVFAMLFSFEAFAAGGVKFISALIKFGEKLNLRSFSGKLLLTDSIPFFIIFAALYIAVMILCGKLGQRARIKSRKELTGSENNMA